MKKSDILSNMLLDGFQEEDSNPINIKLIFYQFLKYWWLILLGIIISVAWAMAYIFYSVPEYRISSSLLIKVDKGIDFTKNAVFSDIEGYESTNIIENELEVLGSYSLMRDAIEDLPLHASYYVVDKFDRRSEIYGSQVPIDVVIHEVNQSGSDMPEDKSLKVHLKEESFSLEISEGNLKNYQYGEKVENWYGTFSIEKLQPIVEAGPEFLIIEFNNKDQLAAGFSSSMSIELSNKFASVVNLSLNNPVPEKGKDVLNKLVETYNLQAVKEKNVIATNTIEFIDEQLSVLMKDLDNIERKVEGYKRTNNISDLSSELSSYVDNSGDYEAQLSRNRTQIEVLESIENSLSNPQNPNIEVTSSLSIVDNTLAGLVERFNQFQSEKERLLRTTQPNNPYVVNIDEQIVSLKKNILTNLSNIKSGLEIEHRNLSSTVNQLDSRVSEVPEIERGLLELTREQGIKQEHYLYLVKKREESELSLAATTVSNSRIIDVASASGGPVSPKKNLILGFALMMGMGIPVAIIYAKNALSGKIVQNHDVKKITSIPIIAEISHNKKKEILAISEKRRTPIAEQFRLLRTNLRFLNNGMDEKVILVTSSISGEGKTFFSLNLGVSLSLTGKKVVILEFDLRKPALLKSMYLKNKVGITNYLKSNDLNIEEIINNFEPVNNLYAIGCGDIPDDPAELMLSEKVGEMIKELKEKFDYIILDTAPVGTVADAFNLVPYTDFSLFLVRYNYTKTDQIKFMEEIKIKNKLKRPYIIMNDAKMGGGYYGYSYGYGYENKKKVYS